MVDIKQNVLAVAMQNAFYLHGFLNGHRVLDKSVHGIVDKLVSLIEQQQEQLSVIACILKTCDEHQDVIRNIIYNYQAEDAFKVIKPAHAEIKALLDEAGIVGHTIPTPSKTGIEATPAVAPVHVRAPMQAVPFSAIERDHYAMPSAEELMNRKQGGIVPTITDHLDANGNVTQTAE